MPGREQAIILYDDEMNVTVVQPNEDGSYWRKIVRNKVVRMKEKRREKAAINFLVQNFNADKDKIDIKSSWGPYITTSGESISHTSHISQSFDTFSDASTDTPPCLTIL